MWLRAHSPRGRGAPASLRARARGPRGGTHPSAAYGTHPSQPQQRLLHAPHSASGTRRARWLVPDTDQLTPCPAVAPPPPLPPRARAPPRPLADFAERRKAIQIHKQLQHMEKQH